MKKTNLWILPSSHIFSSLHHILKSWKALVHINGVVTSRSFPFMKIINNSLEHSYDRKREKYLDDGFPSIFQQKGVDQDIGRRELWLVNFGGQIDGEAVIRMSGRHWIISLRDLIS